jgi:hypothetical protein
MAVRIQLVDRRYPASVPELVRDVREVRDHAQEYPWVAGSVGKGVRRVRKE